MKRCLFMVLCASLLILMGGCTDNEAEKNADVDINTAETQYMDDAAGNADNLKINDDRKEIIYGELFTVDGVIVPNESSFPAYCLKLDEKISITLLDGELSENFDCDTLYFYDDSDVNGNYNYSKLNNMTCTITAILENYRGGGELFLPNPTIMTDGKEAEKNIEEAKSEIVGNFIGKWQDLGWGYSAPGGALRWDVEYRSDGTGTFYFIYEPDDIVNVEFNYTTFDTYLGESVDGILVELEDGSNICYMTKYTWSNELQKMLMTMYEVNSNGTVNLDVYWVYANN